MLRDRQGGQRHQGRRLPVLPGARRRDRHLGRLPGDDVAPGEQLRDRRRDDVARRQPRHLHPAAHQRRRRHALDLRLPAAHQHVPLLRGHDEVPENRPTRPTATATASTSTATSRSARASTASRARRSRAARGNFAGPFELSEPETRNEIWVQTTFKNIKFSNNIHSSGGYFMWPPGSYTPKRVPLPYPPYGTLNFFDQTAKARARRDQVPPRHGDPAAADRPRDRRPLLGRRQLRRRGVLRQRHHRLRLRDRRPPTTTRTRRPARTTCSPGQQPPFGATDQPLPRQRGQPRGEEFASGNYGLLESALDVPERHAAAGRRARPASSVGERARYTVKFTSNEAASIYYTTDGSTPTTASTEWKPPRARALPLPLEIAHETHAEVDRARLQGQRLRGEVEVVHDRDRQADRDAQRLHRGRRCSRRAGRSR